MLNINDITVCTVDAGKSYITYYMLQTLYSLNFEPNVIIMCNKKDDNLYLLYELQKSHNIKIIENFNNKLTPHEPLLWDYSVQHSLCIDYLFKHEVNTKYMLLVDNDIIFKNNFMDFFEIIDPNGIVNACYDNRLLHIVIPWFKTMYNIHIGDGVDSIAKYNIQEDNIYIKDNIMHISDNFSYEIRFAPYCILINKEQMVRYNLKFFENYKTDIIIKDGDYKNFFLNYDCSKDTLSYLTSSIVNNNLPYKEVNIYDYIYHLGGITRNDELDSVYKYKKLISNLER